MKKLIPTIMLTLTGIAHSAVSITAGTPGTDGADLFNGAFNSSDKFYTDTPNLGQSFTTGSNAGGYQINSFSFQLNTTTGLNADGSPKTQDLTFALRLVAMDGLNTTTLHRETGHSITGTTWASGDWLTVSFDSPVMLQAGTQYGVDLEMTGAGSWRNGIPYARKQTSDVFDGGFRYQFGDGDPTVVTADTGHDLVFHADMQAIPEPSVGLMSIAGLFILFQRKRRFEV